MKRIFIGLLALALTTGATWAEPAGQLTLDKAITLAIQNNPQLKAAQARAGVSEADIVTASARVNPSLVSDNGIAEKTYRLGLEQTVELGGKRRRRVALAQAQRDVVLAEINTQLLDIRANVRRAYTETFNLQERQTATQDIVATTERLLAVTRERERAGDVAALDVLQADIITVNAQNDLQTLAYQVVAARNRLNALLNQPLPTTMILTPPGDFLETSLSPTTTPSGPGTLQGGVSRADVDLGQLIQTALARRPELQQNLRNLAVADRQLALARANRIPNLVIAGGYDAVTGQEGAHNAFFVGNLELPILNRQQGPIRQAQALRAQFQAEQAALKNQVTLEVTNAHTAWLANRERVLRYEADLLPKAQTVLEKSRRSFEEGKSPILTPINAQQAFINTRLGYLQALQDTQNAISDLERAIGTGL